MHKSGIANLPLHPGKCPKWLFPRMVKLSKAISTIIINEYGQKAYLQRIADPYFFQSFSCVIGFDWHSSGVTTTTCGALKEALSLEEHGIQVCGGKGAASRKTPEELEQSGLKKVDKLIYASKMSAKVDNSLVQDDYQLYHHCFFVNEKSDWAVVQQGMNNTNNYARRQREPGGSLASIAYARRYHWISDRVTDFIEEPQNAICCDKNSKEVLNMTAKQSNEVRKLSVDLVNDNFFSRQKTLHEFETTKFLHSENGINFEHQKPQEHLCQKVVFEKPPKVLTMKAQHPVYLRDLHKSSVESLRKAYEVQPSSYEELVSLKGIGPKTIRALALVSELVHGTKASWKDPAKYSFAVGGKDRYPYPINRAHYDGVIDILDNSIKQAKLGEKDRAYAIKRLKEFI